MLLQPLHRRTPTLGLLVCSDGGWHRYQVLQCAILEELAYSFYGKSGCRASAETQTHAALDIFDGFPGCLLLKLILAQGSDGHPQGRCDPGCPSVVEGQALAARRVKVAHARGEGGRAGQGDDTTRRWNCCHTAATTERTAQKADRGTDRTTRELLL